MASEYDYNLPGDNATEVEMVAYYIYNMLQDENPDKTIVYIGYDRESRELPKFSIRFAEYITRVSVIVMPSVATAHLAFADEGVLLMPYWGCPDSRFNHKQQFFVYDDADEFEQLMPVIRSYIKKENHGY